GYNLTIGSHPTILINYIINEEIDYHIDELEPIANVLTDPAVIAVSGDSPFDNYEEFAEYVEENPGEVTAGNTGVGSDSYFDQLRWMEETGLEIETVPFEGDGPNWQATAGNQTDATFTKIGIIYEQVEAGNLQVLTVFDEDGSEVLPDVPTFQELGGELNSGSSRGYFAPADLPEGVKQELIDAFEEMGEDSEFQEQLLNVGLEPNLMLGDE